MPAPSSFIDQPPRSVCIFRLSALGDATHVVPVIRCLQETWPETRISWIIGTLEHKLLSRLEGVEFIVFNKRGGWPAIRGLRKDLAGKHFDVLLQMQVAARANLLSRLVKAPVRLGWDKGRSRDGHTWFVNRQVAAVHQQHQAQGFLEFPRALGVDVPGPHWNLPVTDEARQWVADTLPGDQPTLVISPCSSHKKRNWRPRHYARVADHAARQYNMRVVLSGGPSDLEKQVSAAIEQDMQSECINLVGQDTLEQSMAMLQRADLVISPDSGPVHIASALGTPVIGIYAATWARRSGPYNSLDLTVDRYPEAARKFRNCEPGELRWGHRIEEDGVMDLVTVDDVIERLEAWAQPTR